MSAEWVVFVVDAGSVSKGRYYWVCSNVQESSSSNPEELAQSMAKHVRNGCRVALGYESPLFIPCHSSYESLGKARRGECGIATGNRPFNAGAGAAVLATGIQSLAWVLRRLQQLCPSAKATTHWQDLANEAANVLVWEAFVSGSEKAIPASHEGDARLALEAFLHHLREGDLATATRIDESEVLSLAGVAILYAGLSEDLEILKKPCLVLRPVNADSNARS
jgi:hypothetical protein